MANINGLKAAVLIPDSYKNQLSILEEISNHINSMSTGVREMIEARKKANKIADTREKAIANCKKVKEAYFDTVRYHADKLELLTDDREWYLPKYREMLFLR